MNSLIKLPPGQVPAHIAQSERLNLNAAAHANLAPSFAVIGYKGGNWRFRYRGDETPAKVTALSVVIVGMASAVSKAYYEKRYAEGDDAAPDCYSINGVAPDAGSPKKQSPSCAACQWNKFGSRLTEYGKKAKACPDYRRLAIVPSGDTVNEGYGGPMLLRIPPMSLLNLDRYCRQLDGVGADISQVVTLLEFNLDVAYPEIVFSADGWVSDPQDYANVLDHARSDQVRRMLEEPMDAPQIDASTIAALDAAQKPQHMQTEHVQIPPPRAVQQAPATSDQPSGLAQAPAPAPTRASPFAQPAARRAAAPQPAAAPTAPTAQAPTPAAVIQGAPPDMSKAIDDLLS